MKTFVVALCAVPALTASAGADAPKDPKFEFGKAEEVEKVKDVEWDAQAEGGLVFTTGNSETTTLAAGLKAARKTGQNKLALEGGITYARSSLLILRDDPTLPGQVDGQVDGPSEIATDTQTTAETMAAKLRYDRFLNKSSSLFIAALAGRDVPAGKESTLGGQLGYSRVLLKTKVAEAVAELGYDYSHEDLVASDGVSIHSVRGFLGYKAEMTPGTTLVTSLEGLSNLNHEDLATRADGAGIFRDTRINLKFAISAKLGVNLAVQTSIEAKYDNRPGPLGIKNLAMGFVPEAASLDTVMKASLIYSFFTKPDEKKDEKKDDKKDDKK